MTIGERIKQRRTELGLSVDEVAAKIGKARATVYRYENTDIKKMPADILIPLAKALNTTPAYLLGFSEEPASTVSPYEKIQKLCKNEGFEISNLSKYIPELNITKGSISKWKNGAVPRADKLKIIADYFGVSVEWLQGTSEQKEKPHGQAEELKENEIIITYLLCTL